MLYLLFVRVCLFKLANEPTSTEAVTYHGFCWRRFIVCHSSLWTGQPRWSATVYTMFHPHLKCPAYYTRVLQFYPWPDVKSLPVHSPYTVWSVKTEWYMRQTQWHVYIPCNWVNRVWLTWHWDSRCPRSIRQASIKPDTTETVRLVFLTRITSVKQHQWSIENYLENN